MNHTTRQVRACVCVHPGVELCMFYLRAYNHLAQITLPKIQAGSEVGQRFV